MWLFEKMLERGNFCSAKDIRATDRAAYWIIHSVRCIPTRMMSRLHLMLGGRSLMSARCGRLSDRDVH